MSKRFGNLPREGGVTTVGGTQERLLLDATAARAVRPVAQGQAPRRMRSDERRVQFEALVADGRVEEARALQRGSQARPTPQGAVDRLISSGQARGSDGRVIPPGSQAPRVVQGPLHHRSAAPKGGTNVFVVPSVDGVSYQLPRAVHRVGDADAEWKASTTNSLVLMMMVLRELALGGDAAAVFDAFNVTLEDAAGNQLFPIPHELRPRPVVDYETSPSEETFAHGLAGFGFGGAAAAEEAPVWGEEGSGEGWARHDEAEAWAGDAQQESPRDALARLLEKMDGDDFDAVLRGLSPERLRDLGFGGE